MNYGIFELLKLIGSLGVFLYGMKLMSEALQKVAGERMRRILSAMTSNRVKGVITGILITAIIQSSSATTVMVVSFVNAGLLNLVESIGVIMGANVGTTVTAWLISILGFKISMAEISLPLIGLSLPLLFSGKRSRKSWGELIIGFGLLFIGLEFLKNSMPNLNENPEMFTFLQRYTDLGYGSYILFMLIGTILTILIQSSSATMALTLVMCANGWIDFGIAASMVLGENIGTTVTANLAAMVANTAAKRAAFAHFLFNVFGVAWVLSIFPVFLHWIERLSVFLGIGDPATSVEAMPMALSLFHTTFNISNVLILIWFTKLIARIVTRIIPMRETNNDVFTLKHIKIGLLSTPDSSLFQAQQEIMLYGKNTESMFHKVTECLELPNKEFEKQFPSLEKMEDEDLKQLIQELNIGTIGAKVFRKEAAIAAIQMLIRRGGFNSYKIAVIIANRIAKLILGHGLKLSANAALTRWMAIFAGPVGWWFTGLWTAYDLAGPAYRVTIPAVIQIAYMRTKLKMIPENL